MKKLFLVLLLFITACGQLIRWNATYQTTDGATMSFTDKGDWTLTLERGDRFEGTYTINGNTLAVNVTSSPVGLVFKVNYAYELTADKLYLTKEGTTNKVEYTKIAGRLEFGGNSH